MLISEAIAQCTALTGQVVANSVLVRWLSELDGRLAIEFYRTDAWTPYDPTDDLSCELLVPYPWDGIYIHHLAAQTYFSNGEYDRYENERVMSEKVLTDFRAFMQRTQSRLCCGGFPTEKSGGTYVTVIPEQADRVWYWISAYSIAVKHGFHGTEEEWLDSLVGPQGPEGPPGEIDSISASTVTDLTGALIGNGSNVEARAIENTAPATGSTALITSGAVATAVNGKYTKPSGGIPASDIASGVIPSAYTSNPAMNGDADPGSSGSWAKGDHVHPSDTSRAPKNHASTGTGYGAGTDTKYGHVRLSDATNSTSGASGGIAATPAAVKSAYDLANAALPKSGGTMTGNLKLKGDPTSALHAATKQYVDGHYVTAGQKSGTTLGANATAEGGDTTSSGYYSHAEGSETIANGYCAHAEGDLTTASHSSAHAEGSGTTASGNYSHAEGSDTVASGTAAHAEGSDSQATGNGSHAEGTGTGATGSAAHAEGGGSGASGDMSHAEGNWTTASGDMSHAEGEETTASGKASHAEGRYTIAQRRSQHVFGEYNEADASGTATTKGAYIEIVGKGTSENARSNARTLDWNGNEVLAGKLTLGAGPTDDEDAATKEYVDDEVDVVKSALDATQTITTGTLELESGVTAMEASYVLCGKVMNVVFRGLAAAGSSWTRVAKLPGTLTIPSGAREQSVLYDNNASPYTIMAIRVLNNHIDLYSPVATGSYYGGLTFILE